MVKKLHIKHKNAVFNGEASKWQAKEYMHDYRELTNSLVDKTYPKKQGKRKDEMLL